MGNVKACRLQDAKHRSANRFSPEAQPAQGSFYQHTAAFSVSERLQAESRVSKSRTDDANSAYDRKEFNVGCKGLHPARLQT